jgi:hypothetical protein
MEHGIKVICLYRDMEGKRLSAMIKGAPGVKTLIYQKMEQIEELFMNLKFNLDL